VSVPITKPVVVKRVVAPTVGTKAATTTKKDTGRLGFAAMSALMDSDSD
jgi:hypothetical protein